MREASSPNLAAKRSILYPEYAALYHQEATD